MSHNLLQVVRLAARNTNKPRVQLSHLRHRARTYSEATPSTNVDKVTPFDGIDSNVRLHMHGLQFIKEAR